LNGVGPVPLNNDEAVLLGLSSASTDTSGVPQNTVTGRTFTPLGNGQSREMNVNLNGKTITVTHSKGSASPFNETVTTSETFLTLNASGVEPGLGSAANVWTATEDAMVVTIEGEVVSAQGTDAGSRAINLAAAINGNAVLASKGITARASTNPDHLGKLHVGTLAVKATAATDPAAYGDGSVPLATTKLTLSSDLLIGSPTVVSSASATLLGFNVSQTALTDSAAVSVIPVSQGLAAHKEHMNAISDAVSIQQTVVGSRLKRANDQEAVLAQRALSLSQEVSELSTANIENLITELTALMTSQKAARQAYSMVSQSSLFDFIK
jgi:flagellin-like hook-associated protein FlgL